MNALTVLESLKKQLLCYMWAFDDDATYFYGVKKVDDNIVFSAACHSSGVEGDLIFDNLGDGLKRLEEDHIDEIALAIVFVTSEMFEIVMDEDTASKLEAFEKRYPSFSF